MKRLPILLTLAVTVAAAGAAHADKLVIFKNGKAMRAHSVTQDGIWLKCEFENKNYISVKASSVAGIEEAAVGTNEGELRTNKVAAGSGYTPPASQGFSPNETQQHEMMQQQHQQAQQPPEHEEPGAALAEEQEAIRRQGGVVGGVGGGIRGGRRGGLSQQAGPIQGLQPLNQPQTPFQGRRALTQRDQQRRLSRFGQPDPQQEGNQDNN
jgi:hypothetical protein